jgi:hypothetical protein
MSGTPEDLIAEIDKTLRFLDKNRTLYDRFTQHELPLLKKGPSSAMILSQIIVDCYTCLETLFHRIAQHFGNGIDTHAWHRSLLSNMSLEIPDKRAAVLSDTTAAILDELLRFRHFRRYYFDTEYDWDKMEFIEKKYLQVLRSAPDDLLRFRKFLKSI